MYTFKCLAFSGRFSSITNGKCKSSASLTPNSLVEYNQYAKVKATKEMISIDADLMQAWRGLPSKQSQLTTLSADV